MPYTSRHTGAFTPEERDVQAALVDYSTAGTTSLDWSPATILYRRYLDWYARTYWAEPDCPLPLRVRQFGRAIRRLFPAVKRCKRAAARRKRQWGYAFLVGPYSVVTRPPRKPAARAA